MSRLPGFTIGPPRIVYRGLVELARGMTELERSLHRGDFVTQLGYRMTREGLRIVRQLTPRRKQSRAQPGEHRNGGRPIWREWEGVVNEAVRGARFHAVIRNRAALNPAGAEILNRLEFGTKPHKMPGPNQPPGKKYAWSVPGTQVRFVGRGRSGLDIQDIIARRRTIGNPYRAGTTRRGQVVRGNINHPGHAPFAMVRYTVEHLQRTSGPIVQQFVQNMGPVVARMLATGLTPISVSVTRLGPP